jgi:outer membrane immunogenic protein
MKKLLAASVALAAWMVAPALAADMPVKALAPKTLPYDWTGFYVGINGGGGWSFHTLSLIPGGDFDAVDGRGGVAGGFAGYNVQVASWLALGIEGSGAWANIRMNDTDCPGLVALCTNTIKSLASARGRAGVVFERVLGYVATGWGWADASYDRVFLPGGIPLTPGISQSLNGPSSAAGVEVAFTDNFLGRVQYDFYKFKKSFAVGVLDPSVPVDIKSQVHTITFGLAVKFGGPVVASY